MHLLDYVAPSNEVAFDVQLRNRRPVAEFLDTLAHLLILENVNVLVVLNAVELEDLDNVVAEAAPGHLPVALHEEHH